MVDLPTTEIIEPFFIHLYFRFFTENNKFWIEIVQDNIQYLDGQWKSKNDYWFFQVQEIHQNLRMTIDKPPFQNNSQKHEE